MKKLSTDLKELDEVITGRKSSRFNKRLTVPWTLSYISLLRISPGFPGPDIWRKSNALPLSTDYRRITLRNSNYGSRQASTIHSEMVYQGGTGHRCLRPIRQCLGRFDHSLPAASYNPRAPQTRRNGQRADYRLFQVQRSKTSRRRSGKCCRVEASRRT